MLINNIEFLQILKYRYIKKEQRQNILRLISSLQIHSWSVCTNTLENSAPQQLAGANIIKHFVCLQLHILPLI